MKARLSRTLVSGLQPKDKPYEVRLTDLPGLLIRVQPSGAMAYVVSYILGGRKNRITLGSAKVLSVEDARKRATEVLGDVANHVDPHAKRRAAATQANVHTVRTFLDREYGPWVRSHRKDGAATVSRIEAAFPGLLDRPLRELNAWILEKWRSEQLKAGKAKATANRDLVALRSLCSKALEWGHLAEHPFRTVRPLKTDRRAPRFLSPDEEKRLRAALITREGRIRTARDRGNRWRKDRRRVQMPSFQATAFVDHVAPLVLLTLNTGLRQGEAFGLLWSDVHLDRGYLTVRGDEAKSAKTRHVPLNDEAKDILTRWRAQSAAEGLVFPGRRGRRLTDVKTAWGKLLAEAGITGFRFHDLRHSFASCLAMEGVDLNTIRELLGHSDLKMTLIYAHLAPEHTAEAVGRLTRRTRRLLDLERVG